MRNRPLAAYQDVADCDPTAAVVPKVRLMLIAACLSLPPAVVVYRVGVLQSAKQAEYLEPLSATTVTEERIPARDGRLLTTDGQVLAEDRHRFRLAVHYRWLEDPPDKGWLRRMAMSQLTRYERRDGERVDAAIAKIQKEREEVWNRLAALPSLTPAAMRQQRQGIQSRIQEIRRVVLQRREHRERVPAPVDESGSSWPERIWARLVEALVHPPERRSNDPLVLQEELDYHTFDAELSFDEAVGIQTHPERFPGVVVRVEAERVYPLGETASHVVGTRTPSTNEAERYESIGRTGLEKSYDHVLRGRPGIRRQVRNRQGEVVSSEIVRPVVNGRDVVTSLQQPIQLAAESALDEALAEIATEALNVDRPSLEASSHGGCVIVLDVHSGAILAAASAPRLNANLLARPGRDEWNEILSDPRNPLFSRVTQLALPPGSVFKTLTSVALLHSEDLNRTHTFHCQGYLDNPESHRCLIYRHHGIGHGDVTLDEALARSCNVYFFEAARRSGPIPLVQWAERFGFGRPTGVDLPFEQSGTLPRPPGGGRRESTRWYPGDTLGLAIGQSSLLATPLQIARMMAAVANDGYLVTPHFAVGLGPAWNAGPESDEEPIIAAPAPVPIPNIQRAHLVAVRKGLEQVVAHPGGTAHRGAYLPEVSIAGKTGTAEAGGGRPDHAWFAGFAPAERPRIAFVVVLEHGGGGGSIAAPVARQLIQTLYGLGLLGTDVFISAEDNARD